MNARLAAFGHLLILEKPCCPNDLFQKKATVCAKLAKEQSSSFLLLAFFFFFSMENIKHVAKNEESGITQCWPEEKDIVLELEEF